MQYRQRRSTLRRVSNLASEEVEIQTSTTAMDGTGSTTGMKQSGSTEDKEVEFLRHSYDGDDDVCNFVSGRFVRLPLRL